jgi:hypothetical protein
MKSYLIIFSLFAATLTTFAQDTQIKGFNDVQVGREKYTDSTAQHGFASGQFDLFITSRINDNTTFLAEVVFEWDGTTWVLDVERVVARYSFNNYFNLSAGKVHTSFGYWNNAYHHGALIQPTIQRPNIVRFEDEGGFLPVHQVGLQLDGSFESRLNISYNLMLSNGQAKGNSGGDFTHKGPMAFNWSVGMEPFNGAKFILSGISNHIPANTATYQGVRLGEDSFFQMYNASASYFLGSLPIELCAEYYSVSNTMAINGTSRMNGFFGYLGYNKYKIIPYLLYNSIQYQDNEQR